MINKYKLTHGEDHRVFLTSDSHFCHNKEFLYKKRGFDSIEEHDEALIKRWNEAVRDCDTIVHLGDFILGAGEKSKEKAIEILGRLNGKILTTFGNHNAGLKSIYKDRCQEFLGDKWFDGVEVYPLTWKNITFLGYSALLQVKTKSKTHFVHCSHFAHRLWIDCNKGILAANGHSHGTDEESNPAWPHHKRLDVGIENFGGPLDFDKFIEIMDSKSIKIIDHHDSHVNPSF